ncbi:hypothetical protein [Agarivorans gilvus]|uniref:Phage abortive infection protein n=1 Tax=Agarivorans gilvus TaxID=680279 RepID=A0ABQ1I0U9_9ALTE|nr:hypothetical protein [Agarivorans gilvus]GGA98183.1 hypothetical protein GCM10007414_08940 [Agarivorans gilvus]
MNLKTGLKLSVCLALIAITAPLVIYWFQIGKGQVVSSNQEDWANFGSFLAGIYTAIASFGSMGTLIFLIYQNYSEKAVQDKLTLSKIELISFEKYQMHRMLFDKLLDELESEGNISFHIVDRYDLYRKIFPKNTLDFCTYKVNIDEQDDSDALVEARNTQRKLAEYLSSDTRSASLGRKIVQSISYIQDFLNVRVLRPKQDYDFIHRVNEDIILNAGELQGTLANLWNIANSILEFTGNEPEKYIKHMANSSFITDSVLMYADITKDSRHETFMLHQEQI